MRKSNGLSGARSAYLRSAMGQPVLWEEWGEAAFEKARVEDKAVLLDIGAVWCHWCHVMDRESYEDAETARIINEHFVPVKVDRDERPDVDARYQAAVSAISGQGGWPLTAFLTPDGLPFFGGTYFPPVDGHGRPSLRRVLMTMAEAFQNKREEVLETAGSVMVAIEHNESFDGSGEAPGRELVGKIVSDILGKFDGRNGGFGGQPKFPHSGAIDLLIDEAGREQGTGDREQETEEVGDGGGPIHHDTAVMNGAREVSGAARKAAVITLEKMADGGIYDHLAGGFHRYSVDERWVVPHFEKMSYDNSELIRNYVHAYQSFGGEEFARVARECMGWVDEWMSDRERGGFYASQDADYSLEDDGDYFTWTKAEAAEVLTEEEMAVAGAYFDIGEIGDMRHDPLKNVMHVERSLEEVARGGAVSVERAGELIESAKGKMYAARTLRPAPYVDKTVYVGWNSMMVSAYLEAGRVLEERRVVAFGLKTLDRVLGQGTGHGEQGTGGWVLPHVVAYAESAGVGQEVAGGLDDYVFTGHAALDAWECTGEMRYFEAGLGIGEAVVARFYDEAKGGFFDTALDAGERIGALTARRKPLQDSPTPAGNPVGAALLLRLAELTGRADFREKAKATLECFAGVVEHFGLYAASYGLALRRMVEAPVQVVVVGEDAAADELERAALRGFAVGKSVVRLRKVGGELPPTLAETIPHVPVQGGSFAVICRGFTCGLPVGTVDGLRRELG